MHDIEYTSLEKIAVIARGVSWKSGEESSEKSSENIRAYKIPHIIKNKKFVSEDAPLYIKKYKKYEDKLLNYNDILMITSNGNPNRVGNIALYKSKDIAVPASFLLKIRGNEDIEQLFLYYYLSSEESQSHITGNVAGSTGLRNINMNSLKGLKVPVPILKEQQKIAEILSTVDDQIEQTDQLIEKTKELKKGLMQQLLTKGIGHTEFKQSELGEIAINWKISTFKNYTRINQGLQIAIEERFKENGDNRYIYITNQFLKESGDRFFIEDPQSSVICNNEDILMTRTGNTGIVVTNVSGVFHNNFFRVAYDKKELIKDFLVYYLRSEKIQKIINKYAASTTIPDLKHSDFYKIILVIPPIEEQKKIASILTSVDESIEGYEEEKEKYEELKKGLMQQLLTGKTRVKVD